MESQPPSSIYLIKWGSSVGCTWNSTPPWASMGSRGTAWVTRVFTGIWKGISALVPGTPPSPPSLTLVCAKITYISTLLVQLPLYSNFPPFFTLLSNRSYHYCWWTWPMPAADPSWSWLALAFLDMGEACDSFSQSHPGELMLLKPAHANSINMYSNSCCLEKVVLKYDKGYLFYKRVCIFVLSPLQTGYYLQCLFSDDTQRYADCWDLWISQGQIKLKATVPHPA